MTRRSIYKIILPIIAVVGIVTGLGIPVVLSRTPVREVTDPLVISPGPPLPLSVTVWFDLGVVAAITVLTIGLWLLVGRKYAEYITGVISPILGLAGICLCLLNFDRWGVMYWISEYVSLAGFYLGTVSFCRNYRFQGSAIAGIVLSLSSLILLVLFCIVVEECAWISIVMAVIPAAVLVCIFRRKIWPFLCRNKRLSLIAGALVVILIVVGVLQPWNIYSNLSAVIERMQEAADNLQSFSISVTRTDEVILGPFDVWMDIEYSAPDNYHVKHIMDDGITEYILIGDEQYYADRYTPFGQAYSPIVGHSSLLMGNSMKHWIDNMPDIKRLRDKYVDGTRCLYYWGTYDIEKQMRNFYEDELLGGIRPISEEEVDERVEEILEKSGTIRIEFWIGKDDFLPRQVLYVNEKTDESGEKRVSQTLYQFSGYNGDVTVEPPLDSGGELLPGWKTSVPGSPVINEDIQVQVDNYDPSDRKIEYDITLINGSIDRLTDVDVNIASVFRRTEKEPAGIASFSWDNDQWTDGPYILDSEESLKYSCTFRYDATAIEPDMIAEYIGDTYIEVTYFIPNGEQKAEISYLQVPESVYTLSTELAPELIPREVSITGEYRIDEPGATYTGNGIAGIINGTEYLFLEVNTAGAETPASPGILVLDIGNKPRPKKESFISTGDETRYVRGLALYDTVLYISVDENLWILDVSDPSSPQDLSRIADYNANQMLISGKYAFINERNNAITTLDLSDPLKPEKVGKMRLQSGNMQMKINDRLLYAETNTTLYIIDTSLPAELEIIHEKSFRAAIDEDSPDITYPFHIMDMEIRENYAYIALAAESTLALSVLDISEPESPLEIDFYHFKDRQFNGPMFISDDKLYIFTRKNHDIERKTRLDILDISDPDNPLEIGFYVMPDPWSFFKNFYSGTHQTYRMIDEYLYWFIGNDPNQPVIEIISFQ